MIKLPHYLKGFFGRQKKNLILIALIPILVLFSTTLRPSLVQAAFVWPFTTSSQPPASTPPPTHACVIAGITIDVPLSFSCPGSAVSEPAAPQPTVKTTPKPTVAPTLKPTIKPTPKPTIKPSNLPTSTSKDYIMAEINKYRASQVLAAVKTDPYTCDFAKTRAGEIKNGFNHDGFTNRLNSKSLPYPGYHYITENIAMTSNYKDVVNMWINSPGHAKNMRADTPFVCVEQNGNYFAFEGWRP